ncbi:translation initiation factor IF-3 [Labrenzia sp. PHM005]|nr:translation initiation factor IF-3 [Labrenzia sp. PHM005]
MNGAKENRVNGTQFVWQLLKIVCGFVLAVVASGVFLSWGLFRPGHPDSDPVAMAAMIGTGLVTASVIGAVALVPAGCAVVLSELGRQSSVIFHVAAGGLIAFLLWTLDETAGEGLRPGSPIALAAGFIAGAVYWGVAGRTAGRWLGVRLHQNTGPNSDSGL